MTDQLCQLVGSPKQIKWATTIREVVLSDGGWCNDDLALLHRVCDATWFIGNRHNFAGLTYKKPVPHQLVGGPPAPSAKPVDQNRQHRQTDLLDAGRETAQARRGAGEDAFLFAASAATNPLMAEIAMLALLSRMYKSTHAMRHRLKAKARKMMTENIADLRVMDDAVKNLNAIDRILKD